MRNSQVRGLVPVHRALLVFVVCLSLVPACGHRQTGDVSPPLIGIIQVVEHPSMNAVREGFIERMAELGYRAGTTVNYRLTNAQGEMITARSITQTLLGSNAALLFTIGTTVSQTAAQSTKQVPIVFGAVTNPLNAGLLTDPDKPGGNITGVSDMAPFREQLMLLKDIAPTIKTIGMVYNPGEANSVYGVEQTQKYAKELGLAVKSRAVSSSNEVYTAAASLAPSVDAFYTGTDNTVLSSLESILKVAEEHKLPVLAADAESVERGAVASVGLDYKQIGRDCADIADKILRLHETPGTMPVSYASGRSIAINTAAARSQGVSLPDAVMKKASLIYPLGQKRP
jgi:putative ABC transport system substrate-binding protein